MNIKGFDVLDSKEIFNLGRKPAFVASINVTNLSKAVETSLADIADDSWILKLPKLSQIGYKSRLEKSAKNITAKIKSKDVSKITKDSGELVIVQVARQCLCTKFNHKEIPLAELLHSKETGNASFDFHSESENSLIIFGEGKYRNTGNPYTIALTQIQNFFIKNKHQDDVVHLQNLVTDEASGNFVNANQAFAAVFSVNGKNVEKILDNAITSNAAKEVNSHSELYLIGVTI